MIKDLLIELYNAKEALREALALREQGFIDKATFDATLNKVANSLDETHANLCEFREEEGK